MRKSRFNAESHCGYKDVKLIRGNTAEGKELKRIRCSVAFDKGGADNLSFIQLALIENYATILWRRRRLAAHVIRLESLGKKPRPSTIADYLRFSEQELKLAKELGLARTARPVPNLSDYLKQKALESKQQSFESEGAATQHSSEEDAQ